MLFPVAVGLGAVALGVGGIVVDGKRIAWLDLGLRSQASLVLPPKRPGEA